MRRFKLHSYTDQL